jgi:hypothetical protein
VPELALDEVQRDAFAGELERVSVARLLRCEAAPDAGRGRRAGGTRYARLRLATVERGSGRRSAEQRPDRQLYSSVQPRPRLLAAPLVDADLAQAPCLAIADQQGSAPVVEVVLCEGGALAGSAPLARQNTAIIARTRQP